MSDAFLIWSLLLSIALHNAEEALWLPGWTQERRGRWHRPVDPWSFRFAVLVLTLIALLVAVWAHIGGQGSMGHYLLASYALGQGLNVFFPHLTATIATRTYAPGLLTGLLFVLPSTSVLLFRSFLGEQLEFGRFLVVSVIFISLMIFSIPLLFRIGGALQKKPDEQGP